MTTLYEYADEPTDDCTCRWRNYSDDSGWWRVSQSMRCPLHGEPEYRQPARRLYVVPEPRDG